MNSDILNQAPYQRVVKVLNEPPSVEQLGEAEKLDPLRKRYSAVGTDEAEAEEEVPAKKGPKAENALQKMEQKVQDAKKVVPLA